MVPFYVKDAALATIATGQSAVSLAEMRQVLLAVPLNSIYYHFWGKRLNPLNSSLEYLNDFARWAHLGLHDDVLAERLAIIAPPDYSDLEALRARVLDVIEGRMDEIEYSIWSKKESKFYFLSSLIIVFDTTSIVLHPDLLKETIATLSPSSIYFHFIDARRRTKEHLDDFSTWLRQWGDYEQVIARIRLIDPYFNTMLEIRHKLTEVFKEFLP